MARPNKINADYFSHDSDMRNDIRIKALRKKYGHKGYAIWCFFLEVLTDAERFEIELSNVNIELYSADFEVGRDEFLEVKDYCVSIELLQENGNFVYSEHLKERLNQVVENRIRRRENGKKGGNPNFAKGQPNPYYCGKDNHDITTTYSNDDETLPKHKQSKGNESKGNESINEIVENNSPKPLESLFPILDSDIQWKTDVCYGKPKLGSTKEVRMKQVDSYLDAFYNKLKADGVKQKSISDTKYYFNNWLNIELKKI